MLKAITASILLVFAVASYAAVAPGPGPGVVTLYYQLKWNPTWLHYNAGQGWTSPPGVPMNTSTDSSHLNWPVLSVWGNALTFDFNDGHGNWDSNGGQNYKVAAPGIYSVSNGVITTIQTFPFACPGSTSTSSCSGHGTCAGSASTFTCTCDTGYYGADCAGSCPRDAQGLICGGKGACRDGATGDGTCICSSPTLTTCSADAPCGVDLSSDIDHCGSCSNVCATPTGAGVASSSCKNSTCLVTCLTGYELCGSSCVPRGSCVLPPLPNCETFHENQCSGSDVETPSTFEDHRWYTPLKGDPGYQESYQDYGRLVGHAHVVYNAQHTQATVTLIALHRDPTASFKYYFDGQPQSDATFTVDTTFQKSLTLSVEASDGSQLHLDAIDLVWTAQPVASRAGDYRNGQKGAIIEAFGWPHKEIEAECAMLAKAGYMGVKVFPVTEHVMASQPFQNILNPWYFFYQPVSYRLRGRMGTRNDLRSLIQTCRALGVRVYADAVINHMTGSGNDRNVHRTEACVTWPGKNSSATGDVSPYWTQGFAYTYGIHTGKAPSQEFPAVPYGPTDFHCERSLNSWTDPLTLNAGWLTGLTDLNTEKDNVQERIADYLTDLMGIGFSGFRIDAAKHMKPDDLVAILSKFKRNMGGSLPTDFITWLEIILGGEAQLLMCNADSGYNYGAYLTNALSAAGFSSTDIDKIKIWNSGYPKEPDADCGAVTRVRNAIQNDDADQQNPGSSSRDMGDQGCVLIKGCDISTHRSFEVKLFSSPNGASNNDNDYPIRLILSSYYFPNGAQGIPDGLSDCSLCTESCDSCLTVAYSKAQSDSSCGYDNQSYTRVHRDFTIINAMRQWVHLPALSSPTDAGLPSTCK